MSVIPAPTEELAVVEAQATDIAAKIPLIAIADQASFTLAVEDRAEIKRRLARIEELMGPVCDASYKAWKTAVAKRDGLKAPFLEADKAYARAMGAYEVEQERIRRDAELAAQRERERLEREERERVAAEERRLQAEAEERQLAAAAEAEARGDMETAERIASAPIETPVVAPRPVFVPVAPVAPKPTASGISFRDNWSAEVINPMALIKAVAAGLQPVTLLLPNMPALNGLARSLREAMNVPGVKANNERIAAQRKV